MIQVLFFFCLFYADGEKDVSGSNLIEVRSGKEYASVISGESEKKLVLLYFHGFRATDKGVRPMTEYIITSMI